jgi:hypothetical protein
LVSGGVYGLRSIGGAAFRILSTSMPDSTRGNDGGNLMLNGPPQLGGPYPAEAVTYTPGDIEGLCPCLALLVCGERFANGPAFRAIPPGRPSDNLAGAG